MLGLKPLVRVLKSEQVLVFLLQISYLHIERLLNPDLHFVLLGDLLQVGIHSAIGSLQILNLHLALPAFMLKCCMLSL